MKLKCGNLSFSINYEEDWIIPKNVSKFECSQEGCDISYSIEFVDSIEGNGEKIIYNKEDIIVTKNEYLESRYLRFKGFPYPYAHYRELNQSQVEIKVLKYFKDKFDIDTVFWSIFAMERQMIKREAIVFHCNYIEYKGKAILFSGPSGIGKSTQGDLWVRYNEAAVKNGDRGLLLKDDDKWCVDGWPVCGSSEICFNERHQIGAIVFLKQDVENKIVKLDKNSAVKKLIPQLTGGEPFLYKDFERLYTELRDMGMIVTINTNGTLIDENIADLLAANKPRRVNITLYGGSNESYDKLCHNPKGYDQTIRGIKLLKDRKIDVKMNISVVKDNLEELPMIVDMAYRLDIPFEANTYLFPVAKGVREKDCRGYRLEPFEVAHTDIAIRYNTQSPEDFNKSRINFLNKYRYGMEHCNEDKKSKCRAGKSSFWIQWNGLMTPCVFLENIAVDVFEKGFQMGWRYIVEEFGKVEFPDKLNNNRIPTIL